MAGGSNVMSCVVSVGSNVMLCVGEGDGCGAGAAHIAVFVGEGDGNGAGAAHCGCLALGAKNVFFLM